ncbi:MAG: pyruvate ferredoxin oxidoreductase, partial [Chloroflexi bacterium]|nr:pyruvate ferredoxin oxidoreductase [Chloroflexota bacterium]
SPHNYRDLMMKAKKAFAADGPAVLNVLAPCPRGWRHASDMALQVAQIAADTCVWPLYEVENGKVTVNYKPKEKLPVTEWLKTQGRFRHLFRPALAGLVQEIQDKTDQEWEELLKAEANSSSEA